MSGKVVIIPVVLFVRLCDEFVKSVTQYANALKKAGLITGAQHGKLVSDAAKTKLGKK